MACTEHISSPRSKSQFEVFLRLTKTGLDTSSLDASAVSTNKKTAKHNAALALMERILSSAPSSAGLFFNKVDKRHVRPHSPSRRQSVADSALQGCCAGLCAGLVNCVAFRRGGDRKDGKVGREEAAQA